MDERPPHLRAVGDDERAGDAGAYKPPPTPETISEAIDGDGRDVLAAMRKALAKKLDDGLIASNSIASTYKELRELDRLIRRIDSDRAAEEAQKNGANRERRTFDSTAI